MNPSRPTRPLVMLSLLLAALASRAAASGADVTSEAPAIGTAEGEQHPDFLLPALDGGYLRLSDYRGKKVFLFHFASW